MSDLSRARGPIRTTVALLLQERAFHLFAWSFQAPSAGDHTFRYFPRSTSFSGPQVSTQLPCSTTRSSFP